LKNKYFKYEKKTGFRALAVSGFLFSELCFLSCDRAAKQFRLSEGIQD